MKSESRRGKLPNMASIIWSVSWREAEKSAVNGMERFLSWVARRYLFC